MQAPSLRTSLRATGAQYFVNGVVTAAIATTLPEFAERFDLSLGELGLILTLQTVVLIASMQVASWVVGRWGVVSVSCLGTIAFAASPFLVATATSTAGLTLVLACAGITNGFLDAGSPTLASRLERLRQRSRLSWMELCFVLGGIVGAAAAGVLIERTGTTVVLHSVGAVAILVALISTAALRRGAGDLPDEESQEGGSRRRPLALTVLAIVAFSSLCVEGAMLDWTTFLYRERGAEGGSYVLGYLAFTVGLGCALAAGPAIIGRLGTVGVARTGGIIVSVGVTIGLASPSLAITTVALFVVGAGLANIHPLVMSAAGGIAPAVRSIALVNTVSFLGLTGSKPVIGTVGDAISLTWALGLIVVLGLLMAVLARSVAGAEAGQ